MVIFIGSLNIPFKADWAINLPESSLCVFWRFLQRGVVHTSHTAWFIQHLTGRVSKICKERDLSNSLWSKHSSVQRVNGIDLNLSVLETRQIRTYSNPVLITVWHKGNNCRNVTSISLVLPCLPLCVVLLIGRWKPDGRRGGPTAN